MKIRRSSITLLLSLVLGSVHASDATFCYQGDVSGVVCNACADNVKKALMKLDGVQEVRITLNKEGGNPRLTIISKSPALTREAAVKALGKAAENYTICSLEKLISR